jgi:thioredoxin-related protein
MKKLYLLLCFLPMTALVNAQGISFFHGSWEEAIEEAKKQDKIIFIDAYAEWCGPCKRMARNVFTNDRVGEFYNSNFINLKLDMEKGEGLTFRQKYPVSAFPTLFYIDYTGEVVQQTRGAKDVDGFINLGKAALSKIDRSDVFAEEYEKGSRDPELIYNYVKALNQAGKPSLKIANEYLRSQEDLTSDFNLRFIRVAAAEADSRIFSLMVENKKRIIALDGLDTYQNQVEKACMNTLNKAIEFRSTDLLEEAKSKMKDHSSAAADRFALEADMAYFKTESDPKEFMKACKSYAKKIVAENPAKLHTLAKEIEAAFGHHKKCMQEAEKIAQEAAEKGDVYTYYFTYARILHQNGKTEAALEAAQLSLEMAKETAPGAERMVQEWINSVNS